MKKEFVYLLILAFTSFTFASCSSDDDPDYAKEIAATYPGTLTIELANETGGWDPVGSENNKIIIVRTAENIASLKLENFKFMEFEIGTIEVKNIAVSKSGDTYKLSGSDELDLTALGLGKGAVNVTGTVDKDKKCTLQITINMTGDIPLAIRVNFTT